MPAANGTTLSPRRRTDIIAAVPEERCDGFRHTPVRQARGCILLQRRSLNRDPITANERPASSWSGKSASISDRVTAQME